MPSHVIPPKVYFTVFAALIVLFALTLLAAEVDLAPFNALVAMLIASAKALLIALYFMHVRYTSPIARVFALAGFLWLAVLLGFLMADFLTRDWPLSTILPSSATVNKAGQARPGLFSPHLGVDYVRSPCGACRSFQSRLGMSVW